MKLAQKLAVNYIRAKLRLLALVSKQKAAARAFELFCTPLRKTKKKKPPVFLRGEKVSLTIEDLVIRGHRWNFPQNKKCLIIHGFESTSYNFDRYITPLTRKGYEVLAFDAPAHGKSDGKQITLPLYVATLKMINEQFGPIQSFLAHSFGGLALTHFLENNFPDEQFRLVLLAPANETTTAIDSFFRFLHLNGDIRKEFDALIVNKGGKRPEEYSIRRAMQHIPSKVLWIHDEEDNMTPLADAMKIKEDDHPNVEFVITKGLGHRKIYRENQVIKRVIDFL